jgi:DNA-binding NarL/FixJ family response regulator
MSGIADILVVDDRRPENNLRTPSCRADFDVVCNATNGAEAAAQAKDLKPDVVVLDISMPGGSSAPYKLACIYRPPA